jgi:hypothetical protein
MKKFTDFIIQIKDEGKKPDPLPPEEKPKPTSRLGKLKKALTLAGALALPVSGAVSNKSSSHSMGYPPSSSMKATVNENIRRPKKMG